MQNQLLLQYTLEEKQCLQLKTIYSTILTIFIPIYFFLIYVTNTFTLLQQLIFIT
mgnify:CR=1 FL=1